MKVDWEEVGEKVLVFVLVFAFGYQVFVFLLCDFHTVRDLGICPAPRDPLDLTY